MNSSHRSNRFTLDGLDGPVPRFFCFVCMLFSSAFFLSRSGESRHRVSARHNFKALLAVFVLHNAALLAEHHCSAAQIVLAVAARVASC